MKQYPSQEYLRQIFDYHDGCLYWKIKVKSNMQIGSRAGTKTDRYRRVQIDKKIYDEHRVIWIYHNGSIPDKMAIDHIDRDIENNRIDNLRLATYSQNGHNSSSKNVFLLKNRKSTSKNYLAHISINGVRSEKCFYTELEAEEWIAEKKKIVLDNC